METPRRRSGLLTAGGILNIVSGVAGIAYNALLIITVRETFLGIGEVGGETWMANLVTVVVAVIVVPVGLVAIIGGVHALKVKRWGWALAGGICATLASLIPGIIGLVFIIMSKPEFEKRRSTEV
jgi:uncharacterized BrkB/YihY/UPF0761 family membrane protein